MASGWFIDDIELEIAPDTDERNISRTFQSETLFNFFPALTKSTARSFDYTIKGVAYPEKTVFQLDQIAKSADTNIVVLRLPPADDIFEFSKFAVKSLVFTRKGPLFVNFDDGNGFRIIRVYPYTLTLTQLPDEGEFQEGIDGFTDADEAALGLQQLNELTDATGTELDVTDFGPVELFEIITGIPLEV